MLEGDLQLRTLLDGMPRYVPILHLHGRAGWYRRNEGSSERLYTTRSPRRSQFLALQSSCFLIQKRPMTTRYSCHCGRTFGTLSGEPSEYWY